MVDVIRSFQYKTAGRGKGVLGLKDLAPSRRPGGNKTTTVNQTAARDVAEKRPTTTSGERGAAKQRSGEYKHVEMQLSHLSVAFNTPQRLTRPYILKFLCVCRDEAAFVSGLSIYQQQRWSSITTQPTPGLLEGFPN